MESGSARFNEAFGYWISSVYPRLDEIGGDVPREGDGLEVELSFGGNQLTRTSIFLTDLDRELRRAAALRGREVPFGSGRYGLPRPIRTTAGGLELRRAESGSLEIILEPYGLVRDILLYEPLQIAMTLAGLFGGAVRARAWLRRRRDRPSGVAPGNGDRPLLDTAEIAFPELARIEFIPDGARIEIRRTSRADAEELVIVIDFPKTE